MLRHVLPVLMFLVFTSCHGQVKPQNQAINDLLPLPDKVQADTSAPISDYIVDAFEDNQGNLWFGSISDGAIRYDGKSLTYFTTREGLCDNTVVSIAQDAGGNMWFGTHAGATRYDGKKFVSYVEAQGLSGAGCKMFVDSKGSIWAGTNDGAFIFNGTGFEPFVLPNPKIDNLTYKMIVGKVWGIMEDKNGSIWFSRDGYGACKYDGSTFAHYTQAEGLCSNNVSNIVEDNKGNLWIACLSSDLPVADKSGGLCRFDGKTFTKYPTTPYLDRRHTQGRLSV
jgi:ligand-binding sensor domain-containing protein